MKVTDLGVSAEPMEVLDTPPLPSEIGGAMAALLTAVTGGVGSAAPDHIHRLDAVALTVRCLRANPGAAAALGIGVEPTPAHRPAQPAAAPQPEESGPLLDIPAVAAVLDVSEGLVRRMIKAGSLPAVRLGRLIKVRRVDLDAFVTGGPRD